MSIIVETMTKKDAQTLFNAVDNNLETLATLLYNRGKVETLERGVEVAKEIKLKLC